MDNDKANRVGCVVIVLAIMFATLSSSPSSYAAGSEEHVIPIIVRSGAPIKVVVKEIADAFNTDPNHLVLVQENDHAAIERFVDAEAPFNVLVVENKLTENQHAAMKSLDERIPGVGEVCVAERSLLVVTNQNSTQTEITFDRIKELLRRDKTGSPHVYGEDKNSWCYFMLRQSCMSYREDFAWGYRNGVYKISGGYDQCSDDAAVLEKVRTDSGAVGFIQYRTKLPGYAKCLAVKVANGEPSVKPNSDAQMQSDYPLTEPLILLVHPSAPPLAKEFVQFAQGKDASRILSKHGFTTLYSQNEFQAEKRLAEMKLGKGTHLSMAGFSAERDVAQALAVDYVKAKATVQLDFAPAETDMDALGRFLGGGAAGKDLLLLPDRPSESAMKLYGQKWSDLNPQEVILAGRAVAVVVNPKNTLESVTLEQIQSIFSREVNDWQHLGVAGGKINGYGLPPADPSARVFAKEVVSVNRLGWLTAKKNTAEVLAALALDAQGIGFVDVTARGSKARIGWC